MVAAGVDDPGIASSGGATGIAVIGVDRRGENQIMVASGANLDTDAGQIADAELRPGITVLCQNEIRPEATFALLERASARGARTILNLAPAGSVPASVLDGLEVLLVNAIEAAAAAGGQADPADLARELAIRHDLTCIVTLGGQGALAVGPAGRYRVPALPVETIDTTGAGDTFAGVLAGALDRGLALTEALRHASVAASLACTRLGAQTSLPDAAAIAAHLGALPQLTPLA
jgi:ribokinase